VVTLYFLQGLYFLAAHFPGSGNAPSPLATFPATRHHLWQPFPERAITFGDLSRNARSPLATFSGTRHHLWQPFPERAITFGNLFRDAPSRPATDRQTLRHGP
jgi:hypothetical protein